MKRVVAALFVVAAGAGQARAAGEACQELSRAGRQQDALSCFARELHGNPHDRGLREHVAQLLAATGRAQDALVIYDDVLKENPGDRAALDSRGVLLMMLGRDEEAGQAFETALRTHPNDAEAIANLASAGIAYGKFDLAQRLYEKAVNLAGPTRNTQLGMGLIAWNKKDMKVAAQRFGEAVKLAPNDGEAHLWLGRALGTINPNASLAEMEKAVALSPKDPHAWSDLGEMRYRTAHVRTAGEAFSQASKLAPQDPKPWMGIAKCRVDFAELDDADRALTTALGLNPDPLDRYDAYFLRGVIRESQKKPREAEEAYRAAMHVLPTDVRAEVRLAVMQAQAGKKSEALKTFDDILAVDKHCVPAIIDRSALLLDAKRYDEAAKQLAFIKSMSKNDPLLKDVQGLWARINAAKGKPAAKAGRRG